MNEYQYIYKSNNPEVLVILDFKNKQLSQFKNPWGRDSSGTPDASIPFIGIKESSIYNKEIKPNYEPKTVEEIEFLCSHYAHDPNYPRDKRLFFFKTACHYSRQKEKANWNAGLVFLAISMGVFLFYFLPAKIDGDSWNLEFYQQTRIPLLICVTGLLFFFSLSFMYFKRMKTKGFWVLGTQVGLYIFDNKKVKKYGWEDFTGNYEAIDHEQSFILQMKQLTSIYNKYGKNKVNIKLSIVGVDHSDYYLKTIIAHIKSENQIAK